ncbi:hypothetical protein WS71_15065 [Burkholderia mayonis]|uniref:Uncharacterized protein n=1 Tax=Burkholderia mayonis TaxID=1385591 RepID=A0A1B4FYI4_9BURK|nr:hypothetical protein WS71_15065 [Burkholderia mayonis]KVE55154.1 hypothetical protein WS71_31535 [Burkholderia mayonis]
MSNPYALQPTKAFWRPAVGDVNPMEISDLWRPKYPIGKHEPIATLGSSFAQHISRALMQAGYRWLDSEPPPKRSSTTTTTASFRRASATSTRRRC